MKLLSKSPSMFGNIQRSILFRKSGAQSTTKLPELSLGLHGIKVDRKKLGRYCRVCGFEENGMLPPTYPQVLAFPLQLAMLTDKTFPLPLLGAVHIANTIEVLKPIPVDAHLDIDVAIAAQREHEKGLSFDISTEVKSAGVLLWQGTSTMLYRCPSKLVAQDKKTVSPLETNISSWVLPGNLGRRYSLASGDYNPIHLFGLSARLFGFPRTIIHGMWSKAHALAVLEGQLPSTPYQVAVKFKTPILLPNKIRFSHQQVNTGIHFELWNNDGSKPHLSGQLLKISD